MCLSATMLVSVLLITKTKAYTEDHGDTFSNMYTPGVNFNEIFTNSLSMLAEEPTLTTNTKEEDYRLHSIPTQFVEFHQQIVTTTEKVTPPPPLYIKNSTYLKNENGSEDTSSVGPSTVQSTSLFPSEPPEERSVQVIPIKKNYQRGVLDLLFPASRVRAFKSVFDTFRRILSHTFRRR